MTLALIAALTFVPGPTSTITAASDIDDNSLTESSPTTNQGALNQMFWGTDAGGNDTVQTAKIATSAIPAGTITRLA